MNKTLARSIALGGMATIMVVGSIQANQSATGCQESLREANFVKTVILDGTAIFLTVYPAVIEGTDLPRDWPQVAVQSFPLTSPKDVIPITQPYFADYPIATTAAAWDMSGNVWIVFIRWPILGGGHSYTYFLREARIQSDGRVLFGPGIIRDGFMREILATMDAPDPLPPSWVSGHNTYPIYQAYNSFIAAPDTFPVPYWGAILRSPTEAVVAVQSTRSLDIHALPTDAEASKLYSYDEIARSPFDIIITKKEMFLLFGDGRIRHIRADKLEDIADLSKLPKWREDSSIPCLYVLDRDNDVVHFIWGADGYARLDGVNFETGKAPESIAKLFDILLEAIGFDDAQ